MAKTLIIFRLYDPSYTRGDNYGNTETLSVYLRDDNVIHYSLYGSWQDSGTPFCITNLQLQKSLPLNPSAFKNVRALELEIRSILKTGVGSHYVAKAEILNELKEKPKTKSISLKTIRELKAQAKELIDLGDSHEKKEGWGMMRVLNVIA
jgi:hypothetical protein